MTYLKNFIVRFLSLDKFCLRIAEQTNENTFRLDAMAKRYGDLLLQQAERITALEDRLQEKEQEDRILWQ